MALLVGSYLIRGRVRVRGKKRGNVYSHQEEVEQSQAGSGEPGELVLQVVVGLLLQAEVLQGRQ